MDGLWFVLGGFFGHSALEYLAISARALFYFLCFLYFFFCKRVKTEDAVATQYNLCTLLQNCLYLCVFL